MDDSCIILDSDDVDLTHSEIQKNLQAKIQTLTLTNQKLVSENFHLKTRNGNQEHNIKELQKRITNLVKSYDGHKSTIEKLETDCTWYKNEIIKKDETIVKLHKDNKALKKSNEEIGLFSQKDYTQCT